jgi:hypothetical protein
VCVWGGGGVLKGFEHSCLWLSHSWTVLLTQQSWQPAEQSVRPGDQVVLLQ